MPDAPAAAREQILPDAFYTSAEIARIVFRTTVAWFYEHRADLERKDGFPRPINRVGQPRWRGADILAWSIRDRTITVGGPNINVLRPNFTALHKRRK